MGKKLYIKESELAELAKQFREQAGIRKADAARDFKVARSTIQLAEERPKQSLTGLRIRMIEKYSSYRISGPLFLLAR